MNFTETTLPGAWIIDPEPARDARGSFERTFCEREFAAEGLTTGFPQHSLSRNLNAGTLRGMHFQRDPHGEVKVVRCVKGAIFDVIIDLRPDAPSFHRWFGVELSGANGRSLYVPKGFAHGFQTLTDDTEVLYLISEFYGPGFGDGVRYDDPKFGIDWPLPVSSIADKDRAWPLVGG